MERPQTRSRSKEILSCPSSCSLCQTCALKMRHGDEANQTEEDGKGRVSEPLDSGVMPTDAVAPILSSGTATNNSVKNTVKKEENEDVVVDDEKKNVNLTGTATAMTFSTEKGNIPTALAGDNATPTTTSTTTLSQTALTASSFVSATKTSAGTVDSSVATNNDDNSGGTATPNNSANNNTDPPESDDPVHLAKKRKLSSSSLPPLPSIPSTPTVTSTVAVPAVTMAPSAGDHPAPTVQPTTAPRPPSTSSSTATTPATNTSTSTAPAATTVIPTKTEGATTFSSATVAALPVKTTTTTTIGAPTTTGPAATTSQQPPPPVNSAAPLKVQQPVTAPLPPPAPPTSHHPKSWPSVTQLLSDYPLIQPTVHEILALLQTYGPLTAGQLEYNLPPIKGVERFTTGTTTNGTNQIMVDILEILVVIGLVHKVRDPSHPNTNGALSSSGSAHTRYCVGNGIPRADVVLPHQLGEEIATAHAEARRSWERSQRLTQILQAGMPCRTTAAEDGRTGSTETSPSSRPGSTSSASHVKDFLKSLLLDYPEIARDPIYLAAFRQVHVDVLAVERDRRMQAAAAMSSSTAVKSSAKSTAKKDAAHGGQSMKESKGSTPSTGAAANESK